MTRNGVIILIIAMVVCLAGGFFIGNTAQSLVNAPGSENDPLVAQSYVDTLVGERTAALQTKIEELEAQVAALGGKPVASTSGSTSGGTSGGSTTVPEPSTSGSGTTAAQYTKVKVTGNSVNIRKEPSTSSDIVGTAVKGDLLTYVATANDWYKIKLSNGTIGYIAGFLATPQ